MKFFIISVIFFFGLAFSQFNTPENDKEFLLGFLIGIEARFDYDELSKCLGNMTEIYQDIYTGYTKLKTMKLSEITAGLRLLLDAIEDFIDMLQPCWKDAKKLQKLYKEIQNANIMKLAAEILAHPQTYLPEFVRGIECYDKKMYQCYGKVTGDIMRMLFLMNAESEKQNNAIEFIKGLFEGIDAEDEYEKITKCIKEIETILAKIKKALELMKKMRINDLIKGIKLLFEALMELFNMLKPCLDGCEKVKKLIKEIINANIIKIVQKIMDHATEFLFIITKALLCIENKDYHCIGKSIGQMLNLIFLTN